METKAAYLNASSAYSKLGDNFPMFQVENDSKTNFNAMLQQTMSNLASHAAPTLTNNVSALSAIASQDSGLMKIAKDALSKARNTLKKGESIGNLAMAKQASLTDVVTALSEAEIVLQSVITIRDKVIAAYQDIIKMPI
jgi:flagellar hook-basal body complex protein FliE